MIWTRGSHQSAKFRALDCSHEISPNFYFDRFLLLKVYISAKKSIKELWLMTLKSDAQFEEKVVCCFKNDENVVNFEVSTQHYQNFHFDWFLLWKLYSAWSKKLKRRYLSWHEESCKIGKKTDLLFGKWHEEYDISPPEHLKVWKLGLWCDHFIKSRKI